MTKHQAKEAAEAMSAGSYIDLDLRDVPSAFRAPFLRAQLRLNDIITLPKRPVQVGNSIVNTGVVIVAKVGPIDGPGNVLGRAGPTHLLNKDQLPVRGIMEFDQVDLDGLVQSGRVEDVILHEMLHVLGLGPLWSLKGVLRGSGGTAPKFTGSHGINAYRQLTKQQSDHVPVEGDYGAGTRDAHWDEKVFGDELMTGLISGAKRPLSRLSIQSLVDLGYRVDASKADVYALPAPGARLEAMGEVSHFHLEVPDFEVVERIAPDLEG